MRDCVNTLFAEYPKAFEVLHILIAVRDKKEMLLDSNNSLCAIESYFHNADKAYNFICESGLCEIFSDRKIKDLNDFVFGIEVGLDSNARKNRSGNTMESYLNNLFTKASLHFRSQVSIKEFADLHQSFGTDIKKFDFVIWGENVIYFIESNFYTSGGSKLNETARAYQDLALRFKVFSAYRFIWITDGQGWFSAKNKFQEAYKSVEIYNLSNIDDFIQKVKNEIPQ